MIGLLIDIIIFCIIGGLLYWIVTMLPLPQPFKQIVMVCMILILLLFLLGIFFGDGSYAPHRHFIHVSSLMLPSVT